LKIDQANRRISLSIKSLESRCPNSASVVVGEGGGRQAGWRWPRRQGQGERLRWSLAEEILKETPALRRMREKAHNMKFKGGIA